MQHSTFKIFIIIPVFNRKEFTKNCLLSLKKQTYNNFKTIVINDGSTDGTSEMLKKDFPEVFVISGDGNLWWTKATNLGVKYALENNADYILTLNDDTIVAPDFLEKMVYWAKKTPNALLGALALDIDSKKPIYGGEIINWKLANSKYLLDTVQKENLIGLFEVSHFPGRGLFIPKDVFRKIGKFDEKHFPQYAADYDFTHRARKAYFKIYINYDSIIFTYYDQSNDVQLRVNKTFKNYFIHLFNKKGAGNLKVFIFYAIKNCPGKYLPLFLTIGLSRRIFGYPLEYIKEIYGKK